MSRHREKPSGHRRNGLLTGVDQVGVHRVWVGRADTEQAVLDWSVRSCLRECNWHQRRDADAEVDVIPSRNPLLRASASTRGLGSLFSQSRC